MSDPRLIRDRNIVPPAVKAKAKDTGHWGWLLAIVFGLGLAGVYFWSPAHNRAGELLDKVCATSEASGVCSKLGVKPAELPKQ